MAKSIRNRYSRSLEGLNAQGFFSPSGVAAAATAATDLKGFINAAVEGSIAVFNAATNAVVTVLLLQEMNISSVRSLTVSSRNQLLGLQDK